MVFDGNGNLKERFLHGIQIDQVIAQENADGSVYWALGDNLGSVRYVLDNDGNVINAITYNSFGEITSESNPDIDFRFGYTGREFDEETGQYYYRARYYDPTVGRFISEDTIGFDGGDTNLYRYVGNNPTNATDPSGNVANLPLQAAIGAGIDLGVQLFQNKGDFSKVDWLRVAMSGLSALGGGAISAALAKKFASLFSRVVLNAMTSGALDGLLQVGKNALQGCNLSNGVTQQITIGAISGAVGELLDVVMKPLFEQLEALLKSADGNVDDAIDSLEDVWANKRRAGIGNLGGERMSRRDLNQ